MPTPPRIPAPLWSFGRRGWTAIALAAAILIARAAGFDPFAATLGLVIPTYSHGPVMSVEEPSTPASL